MTQNSRNYVRNITKHAPPIDASSLRRRTMMNTGTIIITLASYNKPSSIKTLLVLL